MTATTSPADRTASDGRQTADAAAATPTYTPLPAGIDAARRVLTAVLQAGPALDDALLISQALAVLLDVDPPYPPLGLEDDPAEPDAGIPAALAHLDDAAAAAESVADLCRYAPAAALLNQAQHIGRVRASVTP